ncbi:MAG: RNA-binding domain-containing protein [Candidatus Bathyarchaeota archaeon]|nr:RNA-binding domain-containing protein [Candidatus Bathyarchaeum tardum]
MTDVQIRVDAEVNQTEDLEKVKTAVENMFGPLDFEVKDKLWGQLLTVRITGTQGLTKLSNLLKREQILAAARKVLRNSIDNNSITFYLNKQVAYAGHVSFSQQSHESPLGPITVKIDCDDPKKLVNWLAPRTIKQSSSRKK